MRLNISPNIVSGIYNLAELVLCLLLLSFLRTTISWYNLKTLYDDRKPLRLKTTRLSVLCDPGLAPPNLSRAAVIIAILVLGLSVNGGLGIVGTTEQIYEDVTVKNKVVNANGSYIDFRDHISKDAKRVSGTIVLLQSPLCTEASIETLFLYSHTNDLDDLTTVQWPSDTFVSNSTCAMEESGFKYEINQQGLIPLKGFTSASAMDCDVSYDLADVPRNDITRVPVSQKTNSTCPFHLEELWCSNYLGISCFGSTKIEGGFGEAKLFSQSELRVSK